MYTSLMSSALELAKRKNDEILTVDGLQVKVIDRLVNDVDKEESRNATENSIMLYSELMRSMVTGNMEAGERRETVLMRIFLAFGEMKGAGITPDVACYNSLLRACSFAGDATRAYSVLLKMNEDGLQPNDSSYRYVLRAAVKDGRSDVADIVWNDATTRKQSPYDYSFSPRAADFELLVNTYWSEIGKTTNHTARMSGHRKILDAYECVQLQSGDRGMDRISLSEIEQNQHLMLTVLRSAVSVVLVPRKEETPDDIRERVRARSMAVEIAGLEVMRGALSSSYVDGKMKKALGLATEWMHVN
jgi:pentatricopeptide repeat protein